MSIGDIGCPARRQQPADIRGVHPVEIGNVGCRLANQASESDLAPGPPDRLGQCSRWDRDPGTRLPCTGKQDHDAAVIPVQCDQAARIKGHTRHQAADLSLTPST